MVCLAIATLVFHKYNSVVPYLYPETENKLSILGYSVMTRTIYKVAKAFETTLAKKASDQTLEQIRALADAAYGMWQARDTWKNAALGSYDAEDPYDPDAGAPDRAKSVVGLVDSIYFSAIGMKKNANNYGMSQSEIASRKQQILAYCDKLASITLPLSDPAAFNTLGMVRSAAGALTPATVQPTNVEVVPETVVGPNAPSAGGEAYEEQWNPSSSDFYLKNK